MTFRCRDVRTSIGCQQKIYIINVQLCVMIGKEELIEAMHYLCFKLYYPVNLTYQQGDIGHWWQTGSS